MDAASTGSMVERNSLLGGRSSVLEAGVVVAGALKVRSCLIDGEAVVCDGDGVAGIRSLALPPPDGAVFPFAFST